MIERESSPQSYDSVAVVSEAIGIMHPYLLTDVDMYHREQCCDLREQTAKVCRDLWHKEALGSGDEKVLPLPIPKSAEARVTEVTMRQRLKEAQAKDPFCRSAFVCLAKELLPSTARRKIAFPDAPAKGGLWRSL